MTRSTRSRRSPSRPPRGAALADHRLADHRPDKGVTRYYQLYELLSVALQNGTIAPGSALPSEPELCVRYGLSRTTVRRALDRLEREGRIIRRRGSGSYALPQPSIERFCLELHALRETLAHMEADTTAVTLRFAPAPVPAPLRALAAGIGSSACLVERLRRRGREPLLVTAAYVPEPLGRLLEPAMTGDASILTMLDRVGPPAGSARCSLSAVSADAHAAHALSVPFGTPLLRIRSVLTDPTGRLRAVLESHCRSDRLRLRLMEAPP